MKIEQALFPSVFSNLRIRVLEGHFECIHTFQFSEPTKIRSLKTDRVNGPLDRRIKLFLQESILIALFGPVRFWHSLPTMAESDKAIIAISIIFQKVS